MAKEFHPPSINETAFECPHCGAYTTQFWFELYADQISGERRTPGFPDAEIRADFERDPNIPADSKEKFLERIDGIMAGLILLNRESHGTDYEVSNLHLSKCFNCKKVAAWIHRSLIFPHKRAGAAPNQDLPADIVSDFEEARAIVDISPRGAAALMRLVVQKLCGFLGESGKDLDEDIGNLVTKGLSPVIQQSLDSVRVVGNESVHPGTLDMKDNRDTATRLFGLVNSIADQMISHPKSVQALYDQLPPEKRAAIDARNARKSGKK
ncbi:MAG: DUF4145 domain-containing protein [Steroidobacteraceae bacterium]